MAQDLRSYLDLVKRRKADDFVIVSREVNPNYEITALAANSIRVGSGPSSCSRT